MKEKAPEMIETNLFLVSRRRTCPKNIVLDAARCKMVDDSMIRHCQNRGIILECSSN